MFSVPGEVVVWRLGDWELSRRLIRLAHTCIFPDPIFYIVKEFSQSYFDIFPFCRLFKVAPPAVSSCQPRTAFVRYIRTAILSSQPKEREREQP